jgi:hypothetical protein
MPNKFYTEEQAKRQKEGQKKFHENPNKPTSKDSIKEPRAINNVRRKISDLTDPASDIIRKAVTGGLVPETEVWKGTEEDKQNILKTDKSAKFEIVEVEEGMDVEVLIRYVPVNKNRVTIAQWVLSQDIALKRL